MDTTKLLADAQQVVADIQAIPPTPPSGNPVITSVVTTINYSDGTTAVFTATQ